MFINLLQLEVQTVKKLVIIGAGGLGREVLQYVKDINKMSFEYDILGFIDENRSLWGSMINGAHVIGDFSKISEYKEQIYAICAVANPEIKKNLVKKGYDKGLIYVNLIHPLVYLSDNVNMGEGIIVGPYTVISTNVYIGDHVTINPQCGIGHDVKIDSYSTLYWNVNLAGFTYVEKGVEIGSKAFVKQNIKIGHESIIGAGAVVTKDVNPGSKVVGVPAREI